ncbi:SPOR domain-containing protein [Fundidesulfovibrio terrae]|uniref:SPOR domain-containing protein n=1 Tax=Fundidesulfovibrio terrae TaxID=2922866 RepID=UPI001FAEA65B|nr:SPOR domain-containing protein [Fundidesulfovibrio terrae]
MKVVDRFNVSKQPDGPRKFTFEFTGPGLVSVVVVAVLGIVWVFILGVLVGRGYKPENAVPQVAQIMPSAPAPAQPENTETPTVLKPEELHFQDTLQGRKPVDTVTVDSAKKPGEDKAPAAQAAPPQGGAAPLTPAAAPVQTTALEKTPSALPKGKVATAPAQPDKKTVQADASRPKDAKDSKGQKFSCSYQLAALDKKSQADSEVDRLKKKGIKASVEEVKIDGKTLYRVVAQVKGTEAEIKQTLDNAGAKKPILRDKKSL